MRQTKVEAILRQQRSNKMKWIEVEGDLINLSFVRRIVRRDRDSSFTKPYLLILNLEGLNSQYCNIDYQLVFQTREERDQELIRLLKLLNE